MFLPRWIYFLSGQLSLKAYYWQPIISALYEVKITLTTDPLCHEIVCFSPKHMIAIIYFGNCSKKLHVHGFCVRFCLRPCPPLSLSSESVEICCCHPGFKLHLTSLTVCIHYTALLITDTLLLWLCWSVPWLLEVIICQVMMAYML